MEKRSFYEKKKQLSIVYCCIAMFIASVFTGCSTLRTIDNSDVISANQTAAARIEDTVGELDRTTARSRERLEIIVRDSGKIEDGVSRLEYLFDAYQSEVDRLLDEIDRIRREAAEN